MLLTQLLFFAGVKLTLFQLQNQLEEATDTLEDFGFMGHPLVTTLNAAHLQSKGGINLQ